MMVFPYENQYLGFVQMYHGAPDDMTLDIQLAYSKDGERFERVGDREPIIPLGGIGEWDRFNTCVDGIPVEADGKLRVYFNGAVFRHLKVTGSSEYNGLDSDERIVRIGVGEFDHDRFAAAQASFSGGELVTVPMTTNCSDLVLNAECRFGEIHITFENENHSDRFVLKSDSGNVCVRIPEWAKSEMFCIRFRLRNAKLYSFRGNGD